MEIAKVIAVFGLSGVGKSTTLQRVVSKLGGSAAVVNAGDLIRRRSLDNGSRESLRLLPTERIQHNQEILIEELAHERMNADIQVLLLDGHCVVDNGNQLVPIPTRVIESLDLTAMVFIQDVAGKIRARRLGDDKRSRPDLSSMELACQQSRALEVCRNYALTLGLSLTVVTTEQWEHIVRVVDEVARPARSI